eukprot:TRINITY_DN7111_c0_g1_i1.p1 TRINITY_DN7111_c0_g1~~TRINITY_DN7111_c0_g1_i1.p1  ORF type:complete len:384 (-),score=49.13 TRINITY_DN7111_c0_g1_i1:6-1157(-)
MEENTEYQLFGSLVSLPIACPALRRAMELTDYICSQHSDVLYGNYFTDGKCPYDRLRCPKMQLASTDHYHEYAGTVGGEISISKQHVEAARHHDADQKLRAQYTALFTAVLLHELAHYNVRYLPESMLAVGQDEHEAMASCSLSVVPFLGDFQVKYVDGGYTVEQQVFGGWLSYVPMDDCNPYGNFQLQYNWGISPDCVKQLPEDIVAKMCSVETFAALPMNLDLPFAEKILGLRLNAIEVRRKRQKSEYPWLPLGLEMRKEARRILHDREDGAVQIPMNKFRLGAPVAVGVISSAFGASGSFEIVIHNYGAQTMFLPHPPLLEDITYRPGLPIEVHAARNRSFTYTLSPWYLCSHPRLHVTVHFYDYQGNVEHKEFMVATPV